MTAAELERTVREELTSAGLWPDVDERKSQFLEFPDGLFAEIVLNDGSKLAEAERVVSLLKVESKLDRQELDAIVRANWTIEGVDGPVPAIVVPGGIRSAWAFTATLKAGGLSKTVVVHVTMSAVDAIKRNIAKSGEAVDEAEAIKEVVREFLRLRLSYGGESYWDPLDDQSLELNEDALLYWFSTESKIKH
ncbi:MAG: hypothetical protein WCD47_23195 [Candidatus Sulfotelmatobacter sp.]